MIAPCARAGLLALALGVMPAALEAAVPGGADTAASVLPARAPRPQAAVPLSLLALLISLAALAPLIGDRLAQRRNPAPALRPGAAVVNPAGSAAAPPPMKALPSLPLPATGIDALLRGRLQSLRSHAQGEDLQRRLLIAEAHLDFGHTGTAAGLLDTIEHDCCAAPALNGALRRA